MTIPKHAGVRELVELFGRELANRLEHPVAVAGAAEEALVDQRGDRVDVGAADLLGGLQRATAGEHGQAGEEVLLCRRQEVVAPGDRRAQRPLPLRCRARAAGKQRQPLLESFEQDRRRESLHARSSQFDRERQAVEAPADLGDLAVCGKVGTDGQGTLHEEIDRFPLSQRIDGDLPLAVDVQRLAARDEHRQVRTGSDRLCDPGGCVEQMLEVVQHEQQALVADRCRERVLRPERLSGGRLDECGIGERGERDPPHAAVVVVGGRGGSLQREPRLAAATRARSASPAGRRAGAAAPRSGRSPARGRGTASPEPAGSSRAASSAAGNSSVPSWKRRSGALRSFNRCRPRSRDIGCRPRSAVACESEHLPAVPGGRDPRRPMHVEPHVPLVGPERLARVQPHPHPHRAAAQARACASAAAATASDARAKATKKASPCVSTSTPLVPPPGVSQRAAVLGKHLRIPVAQLLEQPRRTLNVGEEERHGPGRKLRLHPAILSRSGPRDHRARSDLRVEAAGIEPAQDFNQPWIG